MKVGDLVKVVRFEDVEAMEGKEKEYLNATGVITSIAYEHKEDKYPIRVKFHNEHLNKLGVMFYSEKELTTDQIEMKQVDTVGELIFKFEYEILPIVAKDDAERDKLKKLFDMIIEDNGGK